MPVVKDICRICVQEVDYQEVQEINIPKLNNLFTSRPLVNFQFVQKWQTDLFGSHLICSTCIHNFRTLLTVYRDSYKANNAIVLEKKSHKISRVNLKRLARFRHIEGDFLVCRLCLKATMQIAIYLYDNNKNILPMEYIGKMLRHLKIYTNFNTSINPILCDECWENIQVAYSFSKHLELVTEKVFYYKALINKIYIDRDDLQDIIYMWDNLKGIDYEKDILIKQEINEENEPKVEDAKRTVRKPGRPPLIKKKISTEKEEYSFYDEHNYFKSDTNVDSSSESKVEENKERKREITNNCVIEPSWDMPILKPNIEGEVELKDMPKLKPNFKINLNNTSVTTRVLRSKTRFMEENQSKGELSLDFDNDLPPQNKPGWTENIKNLKVTTKMPELLKLIQDKTVGEPKGVENKELLKITKMEEKIVVTQNIQKEPKNTYKGKLKDVKKYDIKKLARNTKDKKQVKKGKMVDALQKKQKDKTRTGKMPLLFNALATPATRPTTRLSTKEEITDNLYPQDLLVLKKEEIIKKKRQRRTPANFAKYTSTPKISKNKQNISVPTTENSPSKSFSNSEYTFETLNLDEEIHVEKEVIEEEELQIKREMLSECESDDQFTENTVCTTYDTEEFEVLEECPNLESFIKSEPPDESYMMDLDEEEPPELEFQGPCQSVPVTMPCCTIQDTFTVDEKRILINTVDEKRNIINMIEQKAPVIKLSVDTRANPIEDKQNIISHSLISSDSFQEDQSKLKDHNKKTKQEASFVKVTIFPNSVEKESLLKFNKNEVINITKADAKAILTKEEEKKREVVAGSSNINVANMESQVFKSSDPADSNVFIKIQASIEKLDINRKNPYYCSFCDFAAISPEVAKLHVTLHAANSLYLHKCGSCPFSSSAKQGLKAHMAKVHNTAIAPFFCKLCDFSSGSEITIKNHLSMHRNNSVILFKCESCTFTSTRKVDLMKHKRTHKSNTFFCGYCKFAINKQVTKIQCENCNLKFHPICFEKDLVEMKTKCQHANITDTARHDAFFCGFCEYAIKKHTRKVKCEVCNVEFHSACFEKDLVKMKTKCRHANISNSTIHGMNPCDRCKSTILSKKRCMDCNQIFHSRCLVYMQYEQKNECHHRNHHTIYEEDVPGANTKGICDYCGQTASELFACMACKRIFHRTCFLFEKRKTTSDCKHSKGLSPVIDYKTYVGLRDGLKTSSDCNLTTSRRRKRETL